MNPAKIDAIEEDDSEAGLEVHPAIQLIIARMESHPEDFFTNKSKSAYVGGTNTPAFHVVASQMAEKSKALWNRKEKRLYNVALRKVRLEEAHRQLVAALLVK